MDSNSAIKVGLGAMIQEGCVLTFGVTGYGVLFGPNANMLRAQAGGRNPEGECFKYSPRDARLTMFRQPTDPSRT